MLEDHNVMRNLRNSADNAIHISLSPKIKGLYRKQCGDRIGTFWMDWELMKLFLTQTLDLTYQIPNKDNNYEEELEN